MPLLEVALLGTDHSCTFAGDREYIRIKLYSGGLHSPQNRDGSSRTVFDIEDTSKTNILVLVLSSIALGLGLEGLVLEPNKTTTETLTMERCNK